MSKVTIGNVKEIFSSGPDFCPYCGSILSLPSGTDLDKQCFVCRSNIESNTDTGQVKYVIHFNDPDVYSSESGKSSKKKKQVEAEGPIVDRECRQCGHGQMSYATLQLRSADEGQTVFYTCVKCKFKESENS